MSYNYENFYSKAKQKKLVDFKIHIKICIDTKPIFSFDILRVCPHIRKVIELCFYGWCYPCFYIIYRESTL